MVKEIIVPPLGESVTEAIVAKWHKKIGDKVELNALIVELETDKVTLEVTAPAQGVLGDIKVQTGTTVKIGEILGSITDGAASAAGASETNTTKAPENKAMPASVPQAETILSPAASKMAKENAVNAQQISGTGKEGRITKEDVQQFLAQPSSIASQPSKGESSVTSQNSVATPAAPIEKEGREERVRMSRLRKKIAERLKDSQNTAAILTTFNEVDMTAVMALRKEYNEKFEKKNGVKLGFMSLFIKASVQALKEWPAVNAEIDGEDIIYKNYYDIGVAVGTDQGLVVPVVKEADQLSFAEIEKSIIGYGKKAKEGKLTMQDMVGGTFTITNGGIYGSLMSTPIINPPQSAILGMHKIQERPMAVAGKVEIRPVMYLALSYDHRIIDGKEAVSFLVRIKELLEAPERLLLLV